jgi:cell shape-determining protein MreC
MTYLRRTNPREKKGRRATVIAVAAVVLLFIVHLIFPGFFARILGPVGEAAGKGRDGAGSAAGTALSSFRSNASLAKENAALKSELAARNLRVLSLEAALRENEELKGLLHRPNAADDVMAVVLVRPPVSPYDTLLIDLGTADGIAAGDKVYAPGAVAIGDVAEALPHQSKVALYSTPGRAVPVLIGSSTVQVQAVGRGGGSFSATLPAEIHIAEGDIVVMPSIRLHTLGQVAAIEIDSTDSLQTVLFSLPINIHSLDRVAVDRSHR